MEQIVLKHIISIDQFKDPKLVEQLFDSADLIRKQLLAKSQLSSLKGKILGSLFFEPSTRTRLSFESAMLRLGGSVVGSENAGEFSSSKKGESLSDMIKVVGQYVDLLVLRHPSDDSAEVAAEVSPVPIINAGSGKREHPTQALLDLYTIKKELGHIKNIKIAFVGDLCYGRTVHSLAKLLCFYPDIEIYFVSPETLKIPQEIKDKLKYSKVKYHESADYNGILGKIDILYMTRVQKERFESQEEFNKVKNSYVLKMCDVKKMRTSVRIMHPLPRVNEIAEEVDNDPRAAYFRQAQNGLYVRMSLLNYLLG